ncbi:MAG: leucine zipper domain-containing protein [Acidimicrobiales bacterium]
MARAGRSACLPGAPEAGASRKTFYKWVKRYREHGMEGLEDRSTRPLSSPNQISGEVEDLIVRKRKELRDAGLDHGATTIQWHHGSRQGGQHGAVGGGGASGAGAARPGRSATEEAAEVVVEALRGSSTQRALADRCHGLGHRDRRRAGVQHHRRPLEGRGPFRGSARSDHRSSVGDVLTGRGRVGTARWGPVRQRAVLLGKLRGFEVLFEANLRDAGIRPSNGRPFPPQTTGKVERFQQTLAKWLRKKDLARSIVELQQHLGAFCHVYNHERPPQGIGRAIPVDRWNASLAARPSEEPAPTQLHPAPL